MWSCCVLTGKQSCCSGEIIGVPSRRGLVIKLHAVARVPREKELRCLWNHREHSGNGTG